MSEHYALACWQCRTSLPLAVDNHIREDLRLLIDGTEPLRLFLSDHIGHDLAIVDTQTLAEHGYQRPPDLGDIARELLEPLVQAIEDRSLHTMPDNRELDIMGRARAVMRAAKKGNP